MGTEVDRSYLKQAKKIHLNNTAAELMQLASVYNEGILTVDGSFSVDTGKHTGRSPKDKHIIADEATLDNVWWENNAKIERDKFNFSSSNCNACSLLAPTLGAKKGLLAPTLNATQLALFDIFVFHCNALVHNILLNFSNHGDNNSLT